MKRPPLFIFMDLLSIVVLAIGLAADCFAVSISKGISSNKLPWTKVLTMALLFGLFQGGMPLITFYLGIGFADYIQPIDHWVAFVLLAFIGGKMIIESRKPATVDQPTNGFGWGTLLTLAIATSIDALAMGIVFLPYPTQIFLATGIIAFISFVASLAGTTIGFYCGHRFKINIELIGGLILIGIGLKILIEHLFFA